MEKITSGPQNVNKPNRKSNYAITTAKKSINTNIRPRVTGNKVDFHEITYFGGAILARGDSETNDHTMNSNFAKVSKPNQELRLQVENNDLIITKDPISDTASKPIETTGPRKFPFLETEPIKNQSLISNIADRRKLMEKYTIKYKNPVDSNILNANNLAKNIPMANVTKTPIENLKNDLRNKTSAQANVVVANDGLAKNLVEVARTKSKCSSKKLNSLDGNVKTMIEKIKVDDSELDNSYQSIETENTDTLMKDKTSVKQFTPTITNIKLNQNSLNNSSKLKITPKKFNGSFGKASKEVKAKTEKNEKLLITLRPTFPNNFTTSSESEIMAFDDLESKSQRSATQRRIIESADPKTKYHNEPKPSTPKNAKDVKQIHQNLLKRNTLLLTQLQKAKLIDDPADEKQEKTKKKKQKRNRKTIRPVSPPMLSGAMSPTTTEVARWVPRSIDDHTKPYYEAWVNTTLAAITKNNPDGEKNDLYVKKKNIIQSFQRALEDYGRNDIVSYEDYKDEKFTGRIKFKVKR